MELKKMEDKAGAIVIMRSNNPCLTLQQIGNKFNVSRERVRQILDKNNQLTKAIRVKVRKHCLNCDKEFSSQNHMFCSRKCYDAYHNILVACDQCGKLFTRQVHDTFVYPRRENINPKNHQFCSRACHGKWLAKNYGFGVNPNHARGKEGRTKKWDWDAVWNKHLETDYGALRLSKLMNIPESTTSYILRYYRDRVTS